MDSVFVAVCFPVASVDPASEDSQLHAALCADAVVALFCMSVISRCLSHLVLSLGQNPLSLCLKSARHRGSKGARCVVVAFQTI